MGKLTYLPLPRFIWKPIIRAFANAYNIRLDEAEREISEYGSLGEFFVRKLKPGLRPLGTTWAVHPADAVITQASVIDRGLLIQAKNKFYRLADFTHDEKALEKYDQGVFLTYYLCPTDYHRVHSPVDGIIRKVTHIPGMLWPVNQWSTENIEEMFSINERVCVEIETERGLVNVVFVGATNVGHISLSFMPDIRGNQFSVFKPLHRDHLNISIRKGEELGLFKMGSTVVMIYQKGVISAVEGLVQLRQRAVRVNADFLS